MDRPLYVVEANRSVPVGCMLARAAEASVPANFVAGHAFDAVVDPAAVPCRTELTFYNPHRSLSQLDGDILRGIRTEGLRPANLHEGIEFALAYREALLAALPVSVLGDVIRLPNLGEGTTRFVPAFGEDGKGGVVLTLIERSNFWGPVNFLVAKL